MLLISHNYEKVAVSDHACILWKSEVHFFSLTLLMVEGASSMSAIALTGVSTGALGTWLSFLLESRGGLLQAENFDPE